MKILVCIKQTVMLPGAVVLRSDGSDVDPDFTRRALNDPDRYALEEALSLCESIGDGEVVVVTVGPESAMKELRQCMAIGAHRAIRIWQPGMTSHDPLVVARALAKVAIDEAPDLILCGVQSEDAAQQATGVALASALKQTCVTMATKLTITLPDGQALIHREASGGYTQVVEVDLPCVITVQTGINTPRKESFKSMMMAKNVTISTVEPGPIAPSSIQVLGVRVRAPERGTLRLIEGGPSEVAANIRSLMQEES